MRITRLELHGFKSFADRTICTFGPGISCVVGPNGCGKSNVVDALKWVIGEQSAKSLRGGEMQDVIFAGSSERKPVGYAEVGLTFTSEGAEPFPGEYARYTELQVARRLYRSGASEYLINQTRVRRKDIVDLLMDSGVGNNLYSFIEQGRIGKIVAASPEERRSLIDEAAGITRYKQRRKEARSKLEATSTQLDRAADVSDEMGRRLKTLERQVVKAARFRRLRALVRQEEIFLSLAKFADLEREVEELGTLVQRLTAEVASDEERQSVLEEDIGVRTGEVEVAEASAEVARDALGEVDAQRREVEATIALHRQRGEELRRQLSESVADLEADVERARAAERDQSESEAVLARIADRIEAAEDADETLHEQLQELQLARDAARDALRMGELEANQLESRIDQLRERQEILDLRAREIPERLVRLDERLAMASEEAVVLKKRAEVAEEVIEERTERLEAVEDELTAHEERVDTFVRSDVHARDAVRAAQTELDASSRELDEAVARAEASAGLAEEEVVARVAVVQQREDNALLEAERTDTRRLAALEAQARQEQAQAATRGRSWLDAASKGAETVLASWRREAEAAVEHEESARQQALDTLAREAAADVEQVEITARAELERSLQAVRAQRERAETRLEEHRDRQAHIEARRAIALRRRNEIEGRVAALTAEESASRGRDAGARAVTERLGELPRLLDQLELPEERRAELGRILGERLLLPVVQGADQVIAASEAVLEAGSARLMFSPGVATLEGLLQPLELADDLASALTRFADNGAAAVVRSTGERIDADGLVTLGRTGGAAEASLARRDELATLADELDAVLAELEGLDTEFTEARAGIEAARITARKATERHDQLDKAGRETIRARLAEARKAHERSVAELRESRGRWRAEARRALEAELRQRVNTRDEQAGALRQELDALMAGHRQDAERRLAAVRQELEAAREARRTESVARIDTAREEAWEAVRATTADAQVRRDALREELDGRRTQMERVRTRADRAAEALEEARRGREVLNQQAAEHKLLLVRMQAELQSAHDQASGLVDRRAGLVADKETLEASAKETTRALAEIVARLEELDETSDDAGTRLEDLRSSAMARDDEVARVRMQRDEARAALASLRERRASAEATLQGALRQLETASERHATARQRIGELEVLTQEAERSLAESRESGDRLSEERQVAATRHEHARERLIEVREARGLVEGEERAVSTRLAEARHALVSAEQRWHQARTTLDGLVARMEERYQVDLAHYLRHLIERSGLRLDAPEEVRAGLEIAGKSVEPVGDLVLRPEMLEDEDRVRQFVESIEEHRAELTRIGDVNLTALEEYTELFERYDDLEGQRLDLDESVASIRSAIAKMNKTCRERFRDTYERVNAAFKKAYPDLVGGGEARLSLTDEEDMLETGVEIFVRPPGKRLQNLTLLSGGEKAMTAIALLLALFTVKPSPFCVLDEVDAPLDEANGARFNDMIRHMAHMTQFIVITHNRKTMECADTLYGITMPQPGCSALVAVQIDG